MKVNSMNKVIVFSRFKSLLFLLFVISSFGVNFVDSFGASLPVTDEKLIPKGIPINVNDLNEEQKGIAEQILDSDGALDEGMVKIFAGGIADTIGDFLSVDSTNIANMIINSGADAINVATAFQRVANALAEKNLVIKDIDEGQFFKAVEAEVEKIGKVVKNPKEIEKIVLENGTEKVHQPKEENTIMSLESFVGEVNKFFKYEASSNEANKLMNDVEGLQLSNYRGLYNKIQSEVKVKGDSAYGNIFYEVLEESRSQREIHSENYNKYGIYNVGYIVRRRSLGEQYDKDGNQNPCRFRIGFDKVGIGMKITSFISKSLYLFGVLELTNNVHFYDGSTKNYRQKVGFADKESWIKNDIIGFLNCFYLDFFPMKDVYILPYEIAGLCFSEIPHVPICFSWLWNVSAKASFLNGLLGKRVEFYYAKFRPIMFIIGILQGMFLELVPIVSYDRLFYYNVCKQDDLLSGDEESLKDDLLLDGGELHKYGNCISNFEFLMSVSFTFQLMVLEVKIAKYLYIQFSFWDVVKLIWPKIKAKFVENSDENGLEYNVFKGGLSGPYKGHGGGYPSDIPEMNYKKIDGNDETLKDPSDNPEEFA